MAPLNILRLTPNSGIYVIENLITHEFYIGSSKNIKERLKYHKCLSTWQQHPNSRLYQDMLKYGLENFSFRRMKEVEVEHLKEKKIEYVRMLNPTYNVRSVKGIDIEKQKAAQLRYRQSDKGKAASKRASDKYRKTAKGKAAQLRASLKYRENLKLRKAQYKEYEKQCDQLCKYGYNNSKEPISSLASVGSDLILSAASSSLGSSSGLARQTREDSVLKSPIKSRRVLVAE